MLIFTDPQFTAQPPPLLCDLHKITWWLVLLCETETTREGRDREREWSPCLELHNMITKTSPSSCLAMALAVWSSGNNIVVNAQTTVDVSDCGSLPTAIAEDTLLKFTATPVRKIGHLVRVRWNCAHLLLTSSADKAHRYLDCCTFEIENVREDSCLFEANRRAICACSETRYSQ